LEIVGHKSPVRLGAPGAVNNYGARWVAQLTILRIRALFLTQRSAVVRFLNQPLLA
jgi:hypothetical protein